MDLFCCESEGETRAYDDPVLLEDPRVFQNMLETEDRYVISTCYFRCLQTDLKPHMRQILADWMLEVCEAERCPEEVFPLSINFLDRFLAVVRVRKGQLQLLGAVCLFLASKMRQSHPISAERLCHYTDNSITISELLDWEMLVLSRLKWDLAAVTPFEFVAPILRRLQVHPHQEPLIKRHAHVFIGLCASHVKFSMYPSSMIAAASIGASIQGLISRLDLQWSSVNELLARLHEITGIDVDCLRACLEQIEETVVSRLASAHQVSIADPLDPRPNQKLAEHHEDDVEIIQAETPTDVQDVLF